MIASGEPWRLSAFLMKVRGSLVAGPGDVPLEELAFLVDGWRQVVNLAIEIHDTALEQEVLDVVQG